MFRSPRDHRRIVALLSVAGVLLVGEYVWFMLSGPVPLALAYLPLVPILIAGWIDLRPRPLLPPRHTHACPRCERPTYHCQGESCRSGNPMIAYCDDCLVRMVAER